MLKNINIKKFRKFNELFLEIPSRLTLISGTNGIGKSTLLGIIANGSGTKSFKTLSNKDFHPEFKDYFILSKDEHRDARKFDDYYEVTLKYNYKNMDIFKRVRTSHPNEPYLKLVPRTVSFDGVQNEVVTNDVYSKTGITESGRIPLPTFFVSTSRLFPFGESKSTDENLTKVTNRKNINNQEHITKNYIEMYNKVLPRSIDPKKDELYETIKPKIKYSGFYVKPDSSSILTQSIGQDSISGILNALLSFENISNEPNYNGGILCIDELDASLHPDAQIRLLRLLREQAEKLNLQIIFTSHSLTIIKEMLKLQNKDKTKFAVLYFRNNLRPYYRGTDTYTSIKADLFSQIQYSMPKVKIYLEDEEARFALEQILKIYEEESETKNLLNQCELISSQISCSTLLNLPEKDSYFKDTIIILDGDAKYNKQPNVYNYLENEPIGYNKINNIPSNVLFLPDDFSPEATLFRALYNIAKEEENHLSFWNSVENNINLGNYHPQNILIELDEMIINKKLNRDDFKKWFRSHLSFFEQSGIYKYYYNEIKKQNDIFDFSKNFTKLVDIKLSQLKSKGF
ncbi:AAA family ATPase [Caldibacillus lycopersici]|uniref:AAA family ATPase n=1 Tax=Perspicuibacillus lycopersici TaxID=1325689 RepID=A0AAE3IY17_9BACI|nr:AAA family ATPase [Perspicuibacillus lycopersici]MCU9614130.1 AAA family ATPase [Perspicuibacillus lycopersici]